MDSDTRLIIEAVPLGKKRIASFAVSGDNATRGALAVLALEGLIAMIEAPAEKRKDLRAIAGQAMQLAALITGMEANPTWTHRAWTALNSARSLLLREREATMAWTSLTEKMAGKMICEEYAYFEFDWDTLLSASVV
jgi:hypothetical protein